MYSIIIAQQTLNGKPNTSRHLHSRVEFIKKLIFINLNLTGDHRLCNGAGNLLHLEEWIAEVRFHALQWVVVVLVALIERQARKESHTLLHSQVVERPLHVEHGGGVAEVVDEEGEGTREGWGREAGDGRGGRAIDGSGGG